MKRHHVIKWFSEVIGMRRIFTELRQLIDHPMKLRPSNFGLAHYALRFHNGSNRNGNVRCNDEISA
ncbi:hypothetical protein T08_15208 [Trichinella sp. T8]|nr:hypothetical protein T08_15208 [Trichinella sp. T8]